MSSLQYLADNSYWRNTFNDQLHIIYKEWLYKKIDENFLMAEHSGKFQDDVVADEFAALGDSKEPIKKAVKFNLEKKDKVRQIESKKQRNLHYIFNPTTKLPISPFSRKFLRLNDGTLDEFEREEREKFDGYIERYENEELEEAE